MYVHVAVGLKLFATTVAVKHMAIAGTNLVLVSVGKDVKVLSQTLHGQTFLSVALNLCASPDSSSSQTSGHSTCREDVHIQRVAPIMQQHEFPHKHALNT